MSNLYGRMLNVKKGKAWRGVGVAEWKNINEIVY